MQVVIDFRASAALGAPVIVARSRETPPRVLDQLSPQRRRVAAQLLAGASNKQIARALGISLGTVKDHVHDILVTLRFRSRAELISAALREDWGSAVDMTIPSKDGWYR
jgi:DNA-binding NarL/FixJ family response regulator